MFRILFVVLLFSFALSQPPPLETCGGQIGKVIDARVKNAKYVDGKYILRKGTSVGIDITFKTARNVEKVTAAAAGKINGVELPYPLPNSNGCSVLPCPLEKGGPYNYTASMSVLGFFPSIAVDVVWRLKDENSNVILCILIPAQIK